nr:tyrosine-type recombinase/integrase [Actinomadura bangladeshensis]
MGYAFKRIDRHGKPRLQARHARVRRDADDGHPARARPRLDQAHEEERSPREPRRRETDGHVPANWFPNRIWKPALKKADSDPKVRIHDLRHTHASWLLAGGADLQVVKECLGHGSISTTERYLHTLDDADDTVLAAFDRIRSRRRTD